jgi:hypothetical protein
MPKTKNPIIQYTTICVGIETVLTLMNVTQTITCHETSFLSASKACLRGCAFFLDLGNN